MKNKHPAIHKAMRSPIKKRKLAATLSETHLTSFTSLCGWDGMPGS